MGTLGFASVVSAQWSLCVPVSNFTRITSSTPYAVKSQDPKSYWHSHLRFFLPQLTYPTRIHTCSVRLLSRSLRHSTCETAGTRWHTCKDARVDTCVLKTRRDDHIYKASSTRNGISPWYVATYAFRKWSCISFILDVDNAKFISFVGFFVFLCVSTRVFSKARNVNREGRVQSTCSISVIHVARAQLF